MKGVEYLLIILSEGRLFSAFYSGQSRGEGLKAQNEQRCGEEKKWGAENRKKGEENRKRGEENRKRGAEKRKKCTLGPLYVSTLLAIEKYIIQIVRIIILTMFTL